MLVDKNQLMCVDQSNTFYLLYVKESNTRLNKEEKEAKKYPLHLCQRGPSPSPLRRLTHINKKQIMALCPLNEHPQSPPPCEDRRGPQQGLQIRRRGREKQENKIGVGPSPSTVRRCFKRVGVSRLTSRHLLWLFLTSPDVAFFLNMFQCS